ncbi:hypothetical protein [Microbacterium sp.]
MRRRGYSTDRTRPAATTAHPRMRKAA